MINLLSPDSQRSLQAARLNVILRRYIVAVLFAALAIISTYGVGFWLSFSERNTAKVNFDAAEAKLAQSQSTIDTAATYAANLKIAKQILGSEITYSDFLVKTAQLLPAGTIISNITLTSSKTVTKDTRIEVRGKSYGDILNLKEKLGSSDLFSEVQLVNSTRPQDFSKLSGIQATYPFQAILSVVINPTKIAGATR